MTIIRVQPDSVRQYAVAAQQQFDAIRSELVGLAQDVVEVRYFGPNAVDLKVRSGELAATFAAGIGRDVSEIAEAVRQSTSAIATALGGEPISISVDASPVVPPVVPSGDGSVEVETDALVALRPVVARRADAIAGHLDVHLRSLGGTDWEGRAKERAVSEVTAFTATAKARADEARARIVGLLDEQLSSVALTDR